MQNQHQHLPEITVVPSVFLHVLLSTLEGRADLCNASGVPHFPHLLMMVLTVFHGTFSALDILLYPSPECNFSTFKSLSFFGSSSHGSQQNAAPNIRADTTATADFHLVFIRIALIDGRRMPFTYRSEDDHP